MLQPQPAISAQECARGTRFLMIDAAAATAIGALNSGVVLLALALHIGASTVEIGLLAAIPLLTRCCRRRPSSWSSACGGAS
jgi:hypothetical protein